MFAAPLVGDSSGSTIKQELNAVMSIKPDTVSVSTSTISGGIQIDVTFKSKRGTQD